MEELMGFIKAAFEKAWKETDDECRYDKFATGLAEKKSLSVCWKNCYRKYRRNIITKKLIL
jgi:cation transport regulator ChaB